jgi:hypothetical protein
LALGARLEEVDVWGVLVGLGRKGEGDGYTCDGYFFAGVDGSGCVRGVNQCFWVVVVHCTESDQLNPFKRIRTHT